VNDWLLRRSRRPEATHRLYCFPFAGGSPGVLLGWETRLPQIEVWGVLPPGRGMRYEEPPYTRVADLVTDLVADVRFTPPYLLFGHSLGALLAFETARALQAVGRPAPQALVVSAHRPPHLPHGDEPIHRLPDDEFAAEVARRYPAPPPELAEDPEFLAQSHRMLRSDLELFETYRHGSAAPLSCPVVVLSGRDDHWSAEDLAPWAEHTTARSRVRLVAGDHHYLPEQADEVLAVLAELTGGAVR
jgi:surfactin synthase thioesterase subunit